MKYTLDQIDKINNSISIVKYASHYLELIQGNGKQNNEFYCNCPFHSNDENPSLSFNSEKNVFSCFGCHEAGTIIIFVQKYHKLSFPEAIEHLIKYADLTLEQKEPSDILEYLHRINIKPKIKEEIKREYLSENIMDKYIKKPINEWVSEGIKQEILDEYDVRYDTSGNRIVFPIRDFNGIIAVKGRTLYKNYQDLGIKKYIYYQPIITNDFLFGLYKNLPYIKEKNEILVFEGSKSVMLAEGYGYKNSVSLETNRINEYQKDLLLQLRCNVVLCLDKGIKVMSIKPKNKNIETIIETGLLSKLTNVYVVEDKENLLPDKASPVDLGIEIWEKLYEGRYKII